MKKFLTILLVSIMLFTVSACNFNIRKVNNSNEQVNSSKGELSNSEVDSINSSVTNQNQSFYNSTNQNPSNSTNNNSSNSTNNNSINSTNQNPSNSVNQSVNNSQSPQGPSATHTKIISNYLDGTLYGDSQFKAKMVEDVSEIPTDAIYVATDGNDSNAGTITSPFKTIQKAVGVASNKIAANNNGYIVVRGGEYSDLLRFYSSCGKESNYLVIRAYPNEKPIFSGNGGSTGIFHFGTSKYVIIDGITIKGGTPAANMVGIKIDQSVNHVIIRNCEILNIKTNTPLTSSAYPLMLMGSSVLGINNVLLYNNNIHDCETGWSEALEVVGNCENINIIQNTVKNTGNIGIDVAGNFGYCSDPLLDQARFVVVRGNNVSGCCSPNATSYAIYVDGAKDVIIENNFAYDSLGGIEIGSEEGKNKPEVINIIVRNNIVYNNSIHSLSIGGYNPTKNCGYVKNVKIYNNTFVANNDDNEMVSLKMLNNCEIKNNIFYADCNNAIIYKSDIASTYATNLVFSNNIYYSTQQSATSISFKPGNDVTKIIGINAWFDYSGELNSRFINPLFVLPNEKNYYLTALSPAINTGVNLEVGAYDVLGYARNVGGLDVGGYEYNS